MWWTMCYFSYYNNNVHTHTHTHTNIYNIILYELVTQERVHDDPRACV